MREPMSSQTLIRRASEGGARRHPPGGALGHPLAFAATAALLLAIFGWTFVANPDRVAPTKDPAYYTWRTEMLISDDAVAQLEVEGAFDMFAGGYRVSAPVIGGYMRRVPGVSSLHTTSFLMAVTPVITALLLAGFAYRALRDPLMFHAVAFGSASLYFTPPFVGYLDNVLCLMFLAAALWFVSPARESWPARAGLFLFLLLSGFTHPTTLAVFFLFIGAVAALRLLLTRFDLWRILREDGPALTTALAAVATTLFAWQLGLWGEPASLGEAALPPPYDSSFFVDRMAGWVADMRPLLNGPLFGIAVVALLAQGRWAERSFTLISILWLLPLIGLFGFVAGLTYPYYRFFNTTLAWVLLVGIGAYFVMRAALDRARVGGALVRLVGYAVCAGVVAILATNFAVGLDKAGWNDPSKGWLSASERADLDALRAALASEDEDRPVVFVIDDETASFQIWGFTKLAGNTSRYGLPGGQIARGYLYLGSLDNYLAGEPTTRGEETYDKLSPALLDEIRAGVDADGEEPITVVAAVFNRSGANAALVRGRRAPPTGSAAEPVWLVRDGRVETPSSTSAVQEQPGEPGLGHLARVIGGLALLLLPGALALRWFVPDASVAEAMGMVPALSLALLALVAIGALAAWPSPFSTGLALACTGFLVFVGALLAFSAARSAGTQWPRG